MVHLTGQECTPAQQNPQKAVTAKEGTLPEKVQILEENETYRKKVIISRRRQSRLQRNSEDKSERQRSESILQYNAIGK